MDSPPENWDGWTTYAPLDGPAPGACSFCGRRQDASLLLVASGDGSAAICEDCTANFGQFFARRRAERE